MSFASASFLVSVRGCGCAVSRVMPRCLVSLPCFLAGMFSRWIAKPLATSALFPKVEHFTDQDGVMKRNEDSFLSGTLDDRIASVGAENVVHLLTTLSVGPSGSRRGSRCLCFLSKCRGSPKSEEAFRREQSAV